MTTHFANFRPVREKPLISRQCIAAALIGGTVVIAAIALVVLAIRGLFQW